MRSSPRWRSRLAAMRERDDDAVPGADEALELVLRLGEPTRGDRGPLRLEAMRLALRERIERSGPVERRARAPPRPGSAARSSGCQTRSGARSTGGTRSVGGAGAALVLVVAEVVLDEVGAPLGGGIDGRSRRQRRAHAG